MKNILLVTELYPVPNGENMASSVCHFFTKEWVKEGYNVTVIHFQPVHCWLWYWIVRHFRSYLRNKLGGLFYSHAISCTQNYEYDGVNVFRIPVYQFIPKGRMPQSSLDKFYDEVINVLSGANFTPDIIVGHMLTPEVIPMLNTHYHAKTAMIAHGCYPKMKKRFRNYKELIESYSSWGFRSEAIRKNFQALYGKIDNSFICYSGIPPRMVAPGFKKSCKEIKNFIFVGELIARKYPVELLLAINAAMGNSEYQVTYIGDGPELPRLKKAISDKNLYNKVRLLGRIPRNEVTCELDKADVFAMISRGEAFGLVYIEAMARGCITIASRNEGIDGVIKSGENGFLVKAGDVAETTELISLLTKMTSEERMKIAKAGYITASRMTDHNMAIDYLQKLENI